MSNVICSCLLGDNAKVRLRLSQMLHSEIEEIYGKERKRFQKRSGISVKSSFRAVAGSFSTTPASCPWPSASR